MPIHDIIDNRDEKLVKDYLKGETTRTILWNDGITKRLADFQQVANLSRRAFDSALGLEVKGECLPVNGGIHGSLPTALDPWLGGSLRVELSAFVLVPPRLGRARALLPRRLDGAPRLRRNLWNPLGSGNGLRGRVVLARDAGEVLRGLDRR